jgi:DNA topoisomerase II
MPPKTTKQQKQEKQQAAAAAALLLGDKYKKLDHREHVLSRPGMYIGSVEEDAYTTWVYDEASGRMAKREIRYIPGLYKIVDEILVNAVDHAVRLKQQTAAATEEEGAASKPSCLVKNIRVQIDRATGWFEVTNDGEGIEVEQHPEHGIYIPQLIFGTMLTSTNYEDDNGAAAAAGPSNKKNEERITGGMNGIGAKACNIYSTQFEIETVDAKRKRLYKQTFEKNMSVAHPPVIKSSGSKKPYTTIRFLPDYARFCCPSQLTDDMYALLVKRVMDLCAVTDPEVQVHLNGKKLEAKTFERYVDLYLGDKGDHMRVVEKVNDRLEVIATYHTGGGGMEQVSFVNGIWTLRGGKHVDHVASQIATRVCEAVNSKRGATAAEAALKPAHVKNHLFVFVKSTIPNPAFDSQSKDTLTTPASKFGFKVDLSDKFIDKLIKTGLLERALSSSELQAEKTLKKTDGKKRSTLHGIPKLDDANWAGTARSSQCTLILTEGDSAKSMAIAGIGEVGRDRYGVYPLRGKLLNVKDVGLQKLTDNEEITQLKKILGLESNRVYTSLEDLRYGKILIMTDQDVDGSHIKGLLFNLFQTLWPSLLQRTNFITSMLTPIIKLRRGGGARQEERSFYSMTEFQRWRQQQAPHELHGWSAKYYKGLGTSTSAEAREYFKQLKMVEYEWTGAKTSDEQLDLAFNKKRADDRKAWLSAYDQERILDYSDPKVTYEDFVNRDLIHFSKYDLERSIPSVCDGLKVSQRKVLYACFKRNLVKQEIRVAQLAAYVSEHSAYHHGEASLQSTIVGLAQNFVGSNNVNLLRPNGQFGTRIQGGKDSASPRYIHTVLEDAVRLLFPKADEKVLTYLEDDGYPIEPRHYVPILPMVLVNGAIGIGTGFSTNVPCFNPLDIAACLRHLLLQKEGPMPELMPWYKGFKGTIARVGPQKYVSTGCWTRAGPTKLKVTELPIGTWTEDYKALLEDMIDKHPEVLKSYDNQYTDEEVAFTLTFANKQVLDEHLASDASKLAQAFKLTSSRLLSLTNMYLFNSAGQITKYDNVESIVRDFYAVRMHTYVERKKTVLEEMERDLLYLSAKARFIQAIIDGTLQVHNVPKDTIVAQLTAEGYPRMEDSYDYLLRMPIYALTRERKDELEREAVARRGERDRLAATSERDLWLTELDALEAALRLLLRG